MATDAKLLDDCEKLISESGVLDPILDEIKNLKRGEVSPESTMRRSKIGSYFTSEIQVILNYIYTHKTYVGKETKDALDEVLGKADAILRENIVLQSRPPLDVIKFEHVPVRYSHSTFGRREQRWGYGLHKLPTTELGPSICVAEMPPRYTQSYHNHAISEYTMALDEEVVGITNPGKDEMRLTAAANELLYFSPTTPHTLYNPTDIMARNITVKTPVGLMDWKPIYDLHPVGTTYARVLKGKSSQLGGASGTKISVSIKDEHYDYELEIWELKKGYVVERVYDKDKYFLVIDGDLLICCDDIKEECTKNDYIVIDEDTRFNITARTESRLYLVNLH